MSIFKTCLGWSLLTRPRVPSPGHVADTCEWRLRVHYHNSGRAAATDTNVTLETGGGTVETHTRMMEVDVDVDILADSRRKLLQHHLAAECGQWSGKCLRNSR